MPIKQKLSKRYTLARLDPDWMAKIFNSIKSERLKLAVAVLSVSGCRPDELEKGVMVRVVNGQLSLGIQGSKCNEEMGRGQPLRALLIDCRSESSLYLMQKVSLNADNRMTVTYDAGAVSQRLREKSRILWPKRKNHLVSAYTYRHSLGRAMKESAESPQKIAATLGHASDFSQTAYGRVRPGKVGKNQHGILAAHATNPVRHSSKTDRLDRFTGNSRKLKQSTIPQAKL